MRRVCSNLFFTVYYYYAKPAFFIFILFYAKCHLDNCFMIHFFFFVKWNIKNSKERKRSVNRHFTRLPNKFLSKISFSSMNLIILFLYPGKSSNQLKRISCSSCLVRSFVKRNFWKRSWKVRTSRKTMERCKVYTATKAQQLSLFWLLL